MAALDPRFEFQFELGAPTAANLNTAGGFANLTLSANHWLYIVSGGNVLGSAVTCCCPLSVGGGQPPKKCRRDGKGYGPFHSACV